MPSVDTGGCRPGCECLDCYTTEAINMSSIWTPRSGNCCYGRHDCYAMQEPVSKRTDKRGTRWVLWRCLGCGHEYEETVTVQDYATAPDQRQARLGLGEAP